MEVQTKILYEPERAQATLTMVILVGGIVVLIATTLAVMAAAFANSGSGFRAANQALNAANAAIADANIRIIRGLERSVSAYRLTVDSVPVDVTVAVDSPVANQITVTASSSVRNFRRKVQAVFSYSSTTREVDMLSWNQLVF